MDTYAWIEILPVRSADPLVFLSAFGSGVFLVKLLLRSHQAWSLAQFSLFSVQKAPFDLPSKRRFQNNGRLKDRTPSEVHVASTLVRCSENIYADHTC